MSPLPDPGWSRAGAAPSVLMAMKHVETDPGAIEQMVAEVAPRDREAVRGALARALDSEAELREVAERMAEAQTIARFGNWEWIVASDQVSWSDQLYRIFGMEPGDFEATFDAYIDRVVPEDREWVGERIAAALEAQEPYLFEHGILLPEGSRRMLRCHGQPIAGDTGEVERLVGVCQDVTELAEAEAARRSAELRFRNAFEHAPIGVALVDLESEGARPTEVNRAMMAITGYSAEELMSLGLDEITVEDDRGLDRSRRDQLLAGEVESYSVEKRCKHAGGHQIWCEVSVSLAPGTAGDRPYAIAQIQDISERRRFEQRLRHLADHDPLTGLINRRRFRSELEQRVSLATRYGGHGAVLIVDVDFFKGVNDTLGHHAGDNVLRQVSGTLSERVRESDVVARLSGDEFAVLMPQTDESGAMQLGEDLRTEINLRTAQEEEDGVTVSIGVALFGFGHQTEAEGALVAADLAMYQAKEDGRNRVAVFEDAAGQAGRARRPQTTSARIRDALSDGRLSLYSQPIRSLETRDVERHELLLRMTENGGDPLPAASFIQTAEKVGMVQELDRWVVEHALELVADRQRAGEALAVHVNLSGASVTDIGVLEFIERHLDEGDADPSRITFEITETAAIANFDTAAVFADRLCEFGCNIAIDDYGAGFAPFQYLKNLPFDMIKIDGEFIREMPNNDADQLTVQAMVHIAHGLGKQTIAEFVQDEQTATMLLAYGVDMAQGFHLGRPTPLESP